MICQRILLPFHIVHFSRNPTTQQQQQQQQQQHKTYQYNYITAVTMSIMDCVLYLGEITTLLCFAFVGDTL